MFTPWGKADFIYTLAPGITSVSTPSHGGLHLDKEHMNRLPASYHAANFLGADSPWFEEDCSWTLPHTYFEAEIRAYAESRPHDPNTPYTLKNLDMAHEILQRWYPDLGAKYDLPTL